MFTHPTRFAALALLLSATVFAGDPVPSARRIDWSTAGVPGGIPNRTTVCATLNPGATAAAINSALNACSNGVVKLNAGTYSLTGVQVFKDNVTLRGAGADLTILKGCNIVRLGSGGNLNSGTAITGGGAKDSRTFSVASATGLSVGQMIELDRDDDASFVVSTVGGARYLRQVNVITALSGTSVTVRNPLLWAFDTGSPKVKYTFINTKSSGIEDLRLDHSGTSGCTNFDLQYCDGCWLKGVESFKPSGYHLTILGTVNLEIRDSYIHEAQTFGNNNGGLAVYGSDAYGSNSSGKFENNIFQKNFPGVEMQNSSSGFVIAYNYAYGTASQANDEPVTWMFTDNHGPHDMMNLWEGNVGELFGADGYFGSSSHATVVRNFFSGVNPNSGNTDDPVRLNRLSYSYNLVGNVLGSAGEAPKKYQQAADNCAGGPSIYRLGYPNIGNCALTDVTGNGVPGGMTYPDAKVLSSLLRWGNYDAFNHAARFEPGELPAGVAVPADQALLASYVYPGRPAWFLAEVPWPPIGPDVTNGAGDSSGHVAKINAQLCWERRGLLDGGSYSAAACAGGAGAPADGGVVTPPADAGTGVDAGRVMPGDAGTGGVDAGPSVESDGGLSGSADAGTDGGSVTGCGCSQGSGAWPLIALLLGLSLAVRERAHPVHRRVGLRGWALDSWRLKNRTRRPGSRSQTTARCP